MSGGTDNEHEHIKQSLPESGLLGCLKEAEAPVRLNGPSAHIGWPGLTEDDRPPQTLLGVPIYCCDDHVASIYLVDKEGGQEFTKEDEYVATMLASQAATIISNAERYEEAHRARLDMEVLMDNCPMAVSITDVRTGQITYGNREARRLVALLAPPDYQFGNVFESSRFTRSDGKELSFSELPGSRAIQTGETVIAEEINLHRPDGTKYTFLVNCIPMFADSGELLSVLTAIQDVSSLGHQELWRADFLGRVSEEMRTPLVSIKGSVSALIDIFHSVAPTESMQLLHIIEHQADLMRIQINSLVELTQIETGTLSLAIERVDVVELIDHACEEYSNNHATMDIQSDIREGLATVMADRQLIGKVLSNLLRHAAVHAAGSSPITVSAAVGDIHAAISVSVPGTAALHQRAILPSRTTDDPELFRAVEQDLTSAIDLATDGEGLAMGFCRGVVEAHGGRINREVDEKQGSLTLTFTLPTVYEESETWESDAQESSFREPAAASAKMAQILVSIEDPRLLRTVRQVLHDAGYGTVATSGLDEVAELAASAKPSLVILDIAGREEESFRTLRETGDLPNLPSIVLCDRNDEDYVVRAFDMGADGYMVKPFSPSEMIARIKATFRLLSAGAGNGSANTYVSGDVRINFDELSVSVSGELVQLTATEHKLLMELAKNAGRVLTHDMLLQRVWGSEYSGEPQLLRTYVRSLRRKLGDDAARPSYIFTEHGMGYRMARPDSAASR